MALSGGTEEFLNELRANVAGDVPAERPLSDEQALRILTDEALDVDRLLEIAAIPRERHFGRGVQIHILNNVRNGYCPEDCGYCAQRKVPADQAANDGADVGQPIASYPAKTEAEVLEEARVAYESGAYRYCMVTAGRGPNDQSIERFAALIRQIKEKYPMQICLSAGLVTKPEYAQKLAEAGLDRYNHNLNTSEKHYGEICSTNDYQDRMTTLDTMSRAGVSLCSGVIAGMGESPADLVAVARDLAKRGVPSIPVNFFIPVPGHAVEDVTPMTTDYGLRILTMFRLMNPAAEIRLAAGREIHFPGDEAQARALQAASSLFVSGYLNVRGSDAEATMRMIRNAGYTIDAANSDLPEQLRDLIATTEGEERALAAAGVILKNEKDLRPFLDRQN